MSKFNMLIIGIVIIQIFIYIASPIKHPFEDYFGVVLVGLLFLGIGNLIKIIIKKVRRK